MGIVSDETSKETICEFEVIETENKDPKCVIVIKHGKEIISSICNLCDKGQALCYTCMWNIKGPKVFFQVAPNLPNWIKITTS